LPVPWISADIGSVAVAGSASYSGGVFASSGSGADIWGTADAFRYVYQTLTGDGEIVARVATVSNTDVWTKAGVMIRATLDAGSPHGSMFVSSGKGLALQYRTVNGGTSASIAGGAGTAPAWVRLVRAGTSLTAYRSGDGVAWTKVGAITVSMPATVYIGLALTSHNNSALADATYDNVAVTTSAPTWQHRDIGSVGLAGTFSESGGTFTVQGAGADIWGAADAFHFVYQPLSGDGQIVARIVGVDRTHDWAKAGVMIRETLAAGSKHASLFVSAARGVAFQRRTANGGTSVSSAGSLSAAPRWVKVTRSGSTIAAYESTDGVSWTLVGTETISMSVDVFLGIAVTSHNTAALCTATVDGVVR
jgi:regulation of enolase protein 1 (concanavalin A-like superfamily)